MVLTLHCAERPNTGLCIPWSKPPKKRILVLGGSGFIGQHLVRGLHREKYETAFASREAHQRYLHEDTEHAGSWLFRGVNHLHADDPIIRRVNSADPATFAVDINVANAHALRVALSRKIGAVVDLAGPHSTRNCNLQELFEVALGTALLMRFAEEKKARVIAMSSTEVYFKQDQPGAIREDALDLSSFSELQGLARKLDETAQNMLADIDFRPNPQIYNIFKRNVLSRPYALYKILREILADLSLKREGKVCVLRSSNVFGREDDGITDYLVRRAILHWPLKILNGGSVRTFIGVKDVVGLVEELIDHEAVGFFNITNPQNRINILKLAELIKQITRSSGGISCQSSQNGGISQEFSIEKASRQLGFKPVVGLEAGLQLLAEQYRAEINWLVGRGSFPTIDAEKGYTPLPTYFR